MKVIKIKYDRDGLNVMLQYLSTFAQIHLQTHEEKCLQSVIKRMVQRIMNKMFRQQESYKLSFDEDVAHAFIAFHERFDVKLDVYSTEVIRTTFNQLKISL